jgi:hypothetical protein
MKLPTKRWLATILLAGGLVLVACGPEDGRPRGGGAGADIGNKPSTVVPKSKVFNEQSP